MNNTTFQGAPILLAAMPLLMNCAQTDGEGMNAPVEQLQLGLGEANGVDDTAIEKFLSERYAGKDVWHSFSTKFGETIDCVDFFAQPGVKALARAGKPVTQLPDRFQPSAPPKEEQAVAQEEPDFLFDGRPDTQGKARQCPKGTVPILSISKAGVKAAGGLATFLRAHEGKRERPIPQIEQASQAALQVPGIDYAKYGYVVGAHSATNVTQVFYSLSIHKPVLPATTFVGGSPFCDNHSLAQAWLMNTGPRGAQTVEAGWNVDPNLYGLFDYYFDYPHFFIFATNDQYNTTGCYNNVDTSGGAHPCLPFVLMPDAPMTPGMALEPNPPGSVDSKLNLAVTMSPLGWLISLRTGAITFASIGYYPTSDFYPPMTTQASKFQFGGEVRDKSMQFTMEMGNGSAVNAAVGNVAQVSNYGAGCGASFSTCSGSWSYNALYQPARYKYALGGGTPKAMYYGNVPQSFWGQNVGPRSGSAWAGPGYYTGDCYSYQPVSGLSAATSGLQSAHAILCTRSYPIVSSPGACHVNRFNNNVAVTNQECGKNGDWDAWYAKGECACDEYVAGVAQTKSGGDVQAVLCCKGNFTQTNCQVETFYGGNSDSYWLAGVDWDPFYYKGQCPDGKYVAGISSVAFPEYGVFGAPHALLCCGG